MDTLLGMIHDLQKRVKELEKASKPARRSKRECPTCKNYRFLIVKDKPTPCKTCNWKGQYKLKEIYVCLGCGEPEPCRADCPAGRGKSLVKQWNAHDHVGEPFRKDVTTKPHSLNYVAARPITLMDSTIPTCDATNAGWNSMCGMNPKTKSKPCWATFTYDTWNKR